jgi:dUTPase
MKLFVKNEKGLVLPNQAHPNEDACFDVVAAAAPIITGSFIERMDGVKLYRNVAFIEYRTNLYFAPEENFHVKFFPRSSITKYNLILKNCVPIIDNGYRGEVLLRFAYVFQPEDFEIVPEAGQMKIYGRINEELIYQQGNKIAQFEANPTMKIELEVVDKLPDSQRNAGGFGSSGK